MSRADRKFRRAAQARQARIDGWRRPRLDPRRRQMSLNEFLS